MDLMSGSYTFAALQKKYKNFTVPAAKLKIGGTDILGLSGITVENIQVTLTLAKNMAGSASFTVGSTYDYKNHEFDSRLKRKVILGKEVSVELGYESSTIEIFKGFIASVGLEFNVQEGIFYQITALDVRSLMMNDNFRIVAHKADYYSDAVRKVLSRYKKLCQPVIEATQEKLKDQQIFQEASDYSFIVDDIIGSGKADREFFVVADKAYFRKPKSSSSPLITLGIGKGLKSFQRDAFYLNKKIQVIGYTEGNPPQRIIGEASAKSDEKQTDALGEAGITSVKAPDCHVESELKKRAETIAAGLKDQNMQASISCVGLPELVPGRFVKIDGVDEMVDKSYYVIEVSHHFSQDGFQTTLRTEGWK